jgi:hypothetical protein
MKIFDYVYYRLSSHFFKRDGLEAFTALMVITAIQALSFGILLLIILRATGIDSFVKPHSKSFAFVYTLASSSFYFMNKKVYEGKYLFFREKWRNKESKKARFFRGILVVLFIFLPVILCYFLAKSPDFFKFDLVIKAESH